jgi:pimeloyl-ACP methyl ester carboxylesterase
MADTIVDCANPVGSHLMAVHASGDPDSAHILVCVHGLSRNGRDFDFLARRLSGEARVLAPDIVGRGESDWLPENAEYGNAQYLHDILALFAQLQVRQVDWIGTSMGGIVGMLLASQQPGSIRRLVVNDVGPFIPKAGLERIGDYVGDDPHFSDMAEVRAYVAEIHAPFGPLEPEHIDHMARHSVRPDPSGSGYRLHYDPRIGASFRDTDIQDVDLWETWDEISCPTLVLRGARSDILLPETAEEMTRRGPMAELREIPYCGHAPSLMQPDQIEIVLRWIYRETAAGTCRYGN